MRRRAGFTLVEVGVVVAVIGIAAAIAVPRMAGMLAHLRTRAATNALAADIAYARSLAVKRGERVRLQIEPAAGCPAPSPGAAGDGYRVLAGVEGVVVRRTGLRGLGGRLCLSSNRSAELVFDTRGLPVGHNNRTFVVRDRAYPADTLSFSAVGRVLRRF